MATLIKGETFREQFTGDPEATVIVEFAGPQKHSLPAINDGGTFSVNADTTNWATGYYVWEVWVKKGGVKTLLCRKHLTIERSAIDAIGEADFRSDVRKGLKYAREVLYGKPSMEALEYRINNRALKRHSISDLIKLISHLERQQVLEERKEKGRNVLGPCIRFRL